MYSIQALWTAAQRKLPLTVVVINNAGYGAMRSFSQVMQVRNVPGLDLPGIDFVRSRKAWAATPCASARSSELAPALARGLAHDGVSLIEVMVDSAVPLLYAKKDQDADCRDCQLWQRLRIVRWIAGSWCEQFKWRWNYGARAVRIYDDHR